MPSSCRNQPSPSCYSQDQLLQKTKLTDGAEIQRIQRKLKKPFFSNVGGQIEFFLTFSISLKYIHASFALLHLASYYSDCGFWAVFSMLL